MGKEIKILVIGEWGKNLSILAEALLKVGFIPNLYQAISLESLRVAQELQGWDILVFGIGCKTLPVNEVEKLLSSLGSDIPFINILRLDGKETGNEKDLFDKSQSLKSEVVDNLTRVIKNKAYNPSAAYRIFKNKKYLNHFGLAGKSSTNGLMVDDENIDQQRYQFVLENFSDGVTIINGGQLEYANKRVLDIFGMDIEAYDVHLGLDKADLIDQPELMKTIEHGRENGLFPDRVEFWVNGDHDIRRLICNKYKVIEKGSGVRCLVISTDITDTRKTEAALQDTEKRYRKISELVSDYAYAFEVDPDGSFKPEWLTEAFTRLTGFSTPDEIDAFGGLLSMIHQEDQTLGEKYGESLMSGKAVVSEFRIVTKNGDIRWIRDYSQPVWDEKENRVIRLFGAAQDITQQMEAEEALKVSESRNNAILKTIPDWIFRIRRNGNITDFKGGQDNEIYGSETNIAKKNIKDVFQPQVYESISERIQSALDNGETQKFEFAWNFPDGVRHFEASLVVSGLSEVLMFAHDISVRTRLEKMKSDFINRASHELRTPLTGALLMCDLIEESTTEEERQEYWGHLRNELGRQRSLVERLLTVGRLETGSLKLNPEPLELKPILQEAVDTVFPLAKISSIEVEMEIEEGLPNVIGDKGALEQVFTNLLNNAVKFSPSGSKVRMSAGQKNEGVQVFIRDNGVGIPAEDIPHLFEGFFRAQNVIEKGIPGSGVGLYIVRSIIQELGGSVSVDSQLDMGTTFGVWLPAVRE